MPVMYTLMRSAVKCNLSLNQATVTHSYNMSLLLKTLNYNLDDFPFNYASVSVNNNL